MNNHTIASALQFMIDRTKGKRIGDSPKFLHPIRVAMLLIEAGCKEETVIAGLLHDILEDSETSYKTIESMFGVEVAQIVQSVSHEKESDEVVLNRVEAGGEESVKVKLADNTDNIRTISDLPPKRQSPYLKYANSINDLGRKVLGHNHLLVSKHGEMYKYTYDLLF